MVTSNGVIHAHPTRRAAPAEWAWALAHCLLHLGFGHVPASEEADRPQPDRADLAARCVVVNRFLLTFSMGRAPDRLPEQYPGGDEEQLMRRLAPGRGPGAVRGLRDKCSRRPRPDPGHLEPLERVGPRLADRLRPRPDPVRVRHHGPGHAAGEDTGRSPGNAP